jgi:hypothetical protein
MKKLFKRGFKEAFKIKRPFQIKRLLKPRGLSNQ